MVTYLSRSERVLGRMPWPLSRYFSAYLYIKVSRQRGWPYSLRVALLEATFGITPCDSEVVWKDETSSPLIPLGRIVDWLDRRGRR